MKLPRKAMGEDAALMTIGINADASIFSVVVATPYPAAAIRFG
jgi:hypothetical protein